MLVLFDRLRRTQKQEQSTEFNCPAGTSNSVEGSDSCNWICGDRTKLDTEDWDDGNISSGDGCSDACKIEAGFTCTTDSPSVWSSNWGDGLKVLGYEEWDDGNKVANDGWSDKCEVEKGWNCQGGTISSKDKWYVVWGDELKIQNEKWDDGNIINGDGWSSDCKVEDGFIWTRYDSESADDWNDIWGDGRVFDSSNDFCDDGNIIDGDGCSHDCFVESGWIWTGGNAVSKDICQTVWGDGVLVTASEQWDDGNILNKDGWDSNWKIEPNCYWNMNPK